MRSKVGHYDIVQELGRGGMGVVYKGFEANLNRHVAIKLMSEALAHDPQVVERFLREARSMAQLNDPHIIQIYMIGDDQGQPFFAMEFVEGESLSQMLRREGKLESKHAAGIIAQAAQGLSVAHDGGVVHRDIKPANLMITPRGLVKVADFGIALANSDFEKKLTGTGEFVGTPGYLSPEVCLGKQVDQRSDVFALGIVLFEMLAGRMPFTDQSPLGLMLEVVQADIPDVRSLGADVGQPLVTILNKMLAKDPTQRYQSCHDLLSDLAKTGAIAGTVNVASPAPGVTSAATLPQGVRQPAPITTPRAQLPNQAPPMPNAPPPYQPAPPLAHQQGAQQGAQQAVPAHASASAKPKSNTPIWAIAASVLIVTGVGGYAMRDQLFGAKADVETVSVDAASGNKTSSDKTLVTAANPAVNPNPTANPNTGKTGALDTANAPSDAANPPVANSDESANPGGVSASVPNSTPENTRPENTLPENTLPENMPKGDLAKVSPDQSAELADANAELERVKAENARLAAAAGAAPPAAFATELESTPRAPLAGLRSRIEAVNDKRDLNPRIASNTPSPSVATPSDAPMVPRVVVISIGEAGPGGAAESMIEDALRDSGYTVVDEDAFPVLAALRGRGTMPMILAAAKRAGISAAVIVRVQKTGSQELEFYGQRDTRTLATLEVKAFSVSTGASVNNFREDIGYTGLNAADNGRIAVEEYLSQLVAKLSAHRGRG